METRLSKKLADKIASLDISHPYVWKLRLSEADFNELEVCLSAIVSDCGVAALAKPENAMTTIVYMAEWYKRKYQSGNRNQLIENLDLETLWTNSGISKKRYLYQDDSGQKRWLYSIYVLGGLAIQHEMNRHDKMKFLKGLCRIYHGENYTLENLDEASRAAAFRESIKRQHSLYEYMKEILNGEMPFHEDDLKDAASDVNRFVATIKAANDEILKVKFRFEWQVLFSPDYTYMTRRLNLWLKPEEVGGGLHQYLRYDRVHLWGVPNPEKQLHLFIYIRFKRGDEVIEPSTMENPIITYLNHSVNDFVAFGVEKGVQIKNIPTSRFDKIEILVKDETIAENVYRKRFRDQKFGTTETWNWIYIYDCVSFLDEQGKEFNLYNRIGYDQVTTRLYTDTIRYAGGGKVKHYYIDDPDISDEYEVDELPLIFGWEDVIVRHFATKDDILHAQPEEETEAEKIEFKQENGRYTEWTKMDEPPYGEVTLRVSVKGKPLLFTVVYLPRMEKASPIKRDFERTLIRYKQVDGTEAELQDEIPMDGNPLSPTLPVRYGEGESYYEVDVYRPTLVKEVMLDGKIIEYLNDEEKLNLPYIFKDRVQLNDFSEKGYQAYECRNLRSIYSQDFINISGNPSRGGAALNAWRNDNHYVGKLLDAMAPESLVVCFGNDQEHSSWKGEQALYWNYDEKTEPEPINPEEDAGSKSTGVIFQDISTTEKLQCNLGMDIDNDPWAWEDIDESVTESLLKCFEVANHYGTYFFLMKPLRNLERDKIVSEIYEPLLEKRNGTLTSEDKQGLLRFAEESGFDWQEFNIHIDNEI